MLCLVATLSTQDNVNLVEQLKYDFKRKINWNKYQSKILTEKIKSTFRLRNWWKLLESK